MPRPITDEETAHVDELGVRAVLAERHHAEQVLLAVDAIEQRTPSKQSLMPEGLVNLLSDRQQFLDLAKYLILAQRELAELSPTEIKSERLPDALLQMDAVVQATEQATNTIMEAAEEIMAADPSDGEAFKAKANDACMRIFEACSFQDITGQRITKVVTALQQVESKVEALLHAFGDDIKKDGAPRGTQKKTTTPSGKPARPDEDLLNGPQLPENAISQDDIDALFG